MSCFPTITPGENMPQLPKGDVLYVIRTGMPDLINRQVRIVGPGRTDQMVEVECFGDWTFPHGLTRANVAMANLSYTPKAV